MFEHDFDTIFVSSLMQWNVKFKLSKSFKMYIRQFLYIGLHNPSHSHMLQNSVSELTLIQ